MTRPVQSPKQESHDQARALTAGELDNVTGGGSSPTSGGLFIFADGSVRMADGSVRPANVALGDGSVRVIRTTH